MELHLGILIRHEQQFKTPRTNSLQEQKKKFSLAENFDRARPGADSPSSARRLQHWPQRISGSWGHKEVRHQSQRQRDATTPEHNGISRGWTGRAGTDGATVLDSGRAWASRMGGTARRQRQVPLEHGAAGSSGAPAVREQGSAGGGGAGARRRRGRGSRGAPAGE
jgi:hypothetical protein